METLSQIFAGFYQEVAFEQDKTKTLLMILEDWSPNLSPDTDEWAGESWEEDGWDRERERKIRN